MKLSAITIENFRSYEKKTRIPISNLTTFVGKNDSGKSTILEALEIFFNNTLVKIDDNDSTIHTDSDQVLISCSFDDLPENLVIDAKSSTTLEAEYLLNEFGQLEITKKYDCSKKTPKVLTYARAHHPSVEGAHDLLLLKQADLKKRLTDLGILTDDIDMRSNVAMREAIRAHFSDLQVQENYIDLDKDGDAKKAWAQLKKALPIFVLFQSDRSSKDQDSEVQDPIKLAVKQALVSIQPKLDEIQELVRERTIEVAKRTKQKLAEMAPELAEDITPEFSKEPRWESAFSFSLFGENEVPMNKRGSGARRLVLINFFRAEAERKRTESEAHSIIYAIEEPETSQHPNHQKMLIEALKELSEQDHTQVALTTHVPGLAGDIDTSSIRYVHKNEAGETIVRFCEDESDSELLKEISDTLGILPDHKVRAFLCLEGKHDIEFFKRISLVAREINPRIPDLTSCREVAFIPMGGSSLKEWVNNQYLKEFGRPELHIYDRDDQTNPPYQSVCDEVNNRADASTAKITSKLMIENYLHKDAITEALDVQIEFGDFDSVPEIAARAIHEQSESEKTWDELSEDKISKKKSQVKKRLNTLAVSQMTVDRLQESDPDNDLVGWLSELSGFLE